MDGPSDYYSRWSKSDKESEVLFDIPYIQKPRENDTDELT